MPLSAYVDPEDTERVAELKALGFNIPALSKLAERGPKVSKGNDLNLAARFTTCVAIEHCACCGKAETDGIKFQSCAKCLEEKLIPTLFCSKECLKNAWPEHKQWHKTQKKVTAEHMERVRQPDFQAAEEKAISTTKMFAEHGSSSSHSDGLARGLMYMQMENYRKAAKEFRKLIERDDADPEAYFNLGLAYERCNDDRQATEMFLAAADRHDLGSVKWANSVAAGFERLTYCLLEGKSVPKPKWWTDKELRKISKQVVKASDGGEGPMKMRAETISCSGQFWELRGCARTLEELEEAASLYQRIGKLLLGRGNKDGARTMIGNGMSMRSAAMMLASRGKGAVAVLEVIDGQVQIVLATGDEAHEQARREMSPAEQRHAARLEAKQYADEKRGEMTDDDLNQRFTFFACKEDIPSNARRVIEIQGGYLVRLADEPPSARLVDVE